MQKEQKRLLRKSVVIKPFWACLKLLINDYRNDRFAYVAIHFWMVYQFQRRNSGHTLVCLDEYWDLDSPLQIGRSGMIELQIEAFEKVCKIKGNIFVDAFPTKVDGKRKNIQKKLLDLIIPTLVGRSN